MKIGISAFGWTARFEERHLQILPKIKQMGLAGVEIPMFDPAVLPIEEIRKECEACGLDRTVCAILPKSINPISPDPGVRRLAIEHLIRCVEASAAMGSRIMAGPVFAPIGYLPEHRPQPDEWAWAVNAFQALGDVLDENDVTLAIEPVNRSETFFLRTVAEAEQLCESIDNPRIGITIDTFHANIEERSIPEAIVSSGSRIKHIHASENDRGPLGRGHVPFAEIIAALKKIDFEGYLMIEGFGFSANERDSPGWLWAHPDVSPEELARHGAQFLNRLTEEGA